MNDENTEKRFVIPQEAAGKRLDVFLGGAFTGLSRSKIQKLITAGSVHVNGTVVRKRYLVSPGDRVTISAGRIFQQGYSLEPQPIPLSVLYEDLSFIAINKPAGLVVHPGSGNRDGTLVNALLYRQGTLSTGAAPDRPGIVHRLDKETSGVLVVAKNDQAHAALAQAFSSHAVKKLYVGICLGAPPAEQGTIDMPLGRSRKDPVKRSPDAAGKSSQTDYSLVAYKAGVSIVRFMPRTGRTHQIRVHASCRNFPIAADVLYGGGNARLLCIAPADRPFAAAVLACFSRHALHAFRLTFDHPILRKEVTIEAPLPDDFTKALTLFGRVAV